MGGLLEYAMVAFVLAATGLLVVVCVAVVVFVWQEVRR